ncbi:MAG: hypothetical protein H8E29_00105 [Anaerolineales bacterium]|uniref:Uncharacterized protein n=1 Tax=Candidatus Desulfolinea nitratireducens TaxID=2841698 RepID=A0A8J6TGN6_9CHLR|nr:hypothetical protein [Candidatus Desulfolinea nitratireducens]
MLLKNKKKEIIPASILLVILGIGLFIAFQKIPVGIDYTHYSMSARAFLSGDSRLYDVNTHSYYYMPWGLLITIPLSILPDSLGQAILNLLSLGGIFLSLYLLVEHIPSWGTMLVFINLYTINMVFSGQWDGISVGACAIAWWSIKHKQHLGVGGALLLLTTKPTNMILVTILLGIYILKNWQITDILKSIILPVLILITSFVFCGIDWPWRYIQYLQISPPPEILNLSLWQGLSWQKLLVMLGIFLWFLILVWKNGINQLTISLGMVVNIIISPYVLTYHFLGTSPAFGWLAKKHWGYVLFPWAVMIYHFVTLVELSLKRNFIVYPLSIGIISIIAWASLFLNSSSFKRNRI